MKTYYDIMLRLTHTKIIEMSCSKLFFYWDELLLKSYTVKPVLSGHLNIDKTKVLMQNGSLMKIKSIAECSPWSILQYF